MTWLAEIKARRVFSNATAWQHINPDDEVVALTAAERDLLVAIPEAAKEYQAAVEVAMNLGDGNSVSDWQEGTRVLIETGDRLRSLLEQQP